MTKTEHMNTSEKLKALEIPYSQRSAWKLYDALPEIVAVVEAAQAEVANAQLVCDEEILLDRALAALGEALS